MTELAELLLPWAVSLALLFAIVLWDESRLTRAQLARAWPVSTRAIALVYFGVVALPVHFGRTRRSVLGVLVGVLWAAGVVAVEEAVGMGVDALMARVAPS